MNRRRARCGLFLVFACFIAYSRAWSSSPFQKPSLVKNRIKTTMCASPSNDYSKKRKVDEVRLAARAMQEWAEHSLPKAWRRRSKLRFSISQGVTLPEVVADFWRIVGVCMDSQRAARADAPFRRLHVFAAPFCPDLQSVDSLNLLQKLLLESAQESGCRDLGRRITMSHSHPRSQGSPFPSITLRAVYKQGGGEVKKWPFSQIPNPPPSIQQRRLPPRRQRRSKGAPPPQNGRQGKAGGDRKIGKEWIPRAKSALEVIYNRPCGSASDDRLQPRPGGGVAPENSLFVLESVQAWLDSVLQRAQQSSELASSRVVRRMSHVELVEIVRSGRAADLYSDVWDAIVELLEKAQNKGCAVPDEDDFSLAHAMEAPCYSAVLVTPEFANYSLGKFTRFADSLAKSLDLLLPDDKISIKVFHPEYVTDMSADMDNSSLRRSPWPCLHISYEGVRVQNEAGFDDEFSELPVVVLEGREEAN